MYVCNFDTYTGCYGQSVIMVWFWCWNVKKYRYISLLIFHMTKKTLIFRLYQNVSDICVSPQAYKCTRISYNKHSIAGSSLEVSAYCIPIQKHQRYNITDSNVYACWFNTISDTMQIYLKLQLYIQYWFPKFFINCKSDLHTTERCFMSCV